MSINLVRRNGSGVPISLRYDAANCVEWRRRRAQESVLKTIGPIKMAADNFTAMFSTGEGHDHRVRVLADMLPRRCRANF